MRVIIFGATGMIGYGVLLEALDSEGVAEIVSVGRRGVGIEHPKLREVIHDDFEDFTSITDHLANLDACFWCLGIPSSGLNEAQYTRITHDFTLAAASVLYEQNPNLRFCFVSGAGTDATEQGRSMWARVKGKTENALQHIGFREVILFRPGLVRPMRGSKPRGALYQTLYVLLRPLIPLFRAFGQATSTVEVGQAMIAAAQGLSDKQLLHNADINALAAKRS